MAARMVGSPLGCRCSGLLRRGRSGLVALLVGVLLTLSACCPPALSGVGQAEGEPVLQIQVANP
jgi:xanthine/uracil/vitamin C permease (AzgA family)